MRKRIRVVLSWVCLVTAIVACGSPTVPGEELRLAAIGHYYHDDPRITLPNTAMVGEPVVLRVNSYGGGCTRKGETRTEITPDGPVVLPYDYVDRSRFTCNRKLHIFSHEAVLVFEERGEVRVTVKGRNGSTGALLLAHRTVVVQ